MEADRLLNGIEHASDKRLAQCVSVDDVIQSNPLDNSRNSPSSPQFVFLIFRLITFCVSLVLYSIILVIYIGIATSSRPEMYRPAVGPFLHLNLVDERLHD